MASVNIVGSLYKALENSWPVVAVGIAAVAIVSPLTIAGYAYVSQNPVMLPIACGLAVGVCSMATMKYSGAQRSKSRKQKVREIAGFDVSVRRERERAAIRKLRVILILYFYMRGAGEDCLENVASGSADNRVYDGQG